jgi:predicted dehydrogenase
MTDKNILLFGKGYWGKNWYKTIREAGYNFSVVDPTFTETFDENNVDTYSNVKQVRLKDFTHAIIATPAETHVGIVKEISYDILPPRILVEKPCGTSYIDAEYLQGCYPGFLQLHSPAYDHIQKNIGAIGEPCFYKSIRASMGPRVRTDCTIVEDYLIHDLYLFMDMFGANHVEVVNSRTLKRLKHAQNDTIFLQLFDKFHNVFADMFSSWWYPVKERRIVISGSDGAYLWVNDDLFFTDSRYYTEGEGKDAFGNLGDHLIVGEEQKIELPKRSALQCELDNFLRGKRIGPSTYDVWKLIRKIRNYTPYKF